MNDFLQNLVKLIPETQLLFVESVVILVFLWVIRIILIQIATKRIQNLKTRYICRQTIHYITWLLAFIIMFRLWFTGFQSILTFLGIVAAGLTISMKEPIQNFFAWITILWRELFSLGDRIEVNGTIGDVIDMGPFYFTIMEIGNWVRADQSTGRTIKIPNGLVFTYPVANYNRGSQYIWNEISILITGDSEWKKAKEILQEIAEKYSAKAEKTSDQVTNREAEEYILPSKLTPIVYMTIQEKGISLTIRYLCSPHERRDIENKIWEEILEAFQNHSKIQIAYSDGISGCLK